MSCHWRLEGSDLAGANVHAILSGHDYGQEVHSEESPIHAATAHPQKTGLALPRLTIQFSLVGTGDLSALAATIANAIEDAEVWTLEAPDDGRTRIFLDEPRIALSTVGFEDDPLGGLARGRLAVEAIVRGTWIDDGGTFYEEVNGHFTRTGAAAYTRQDGVATGSAPLLRLPIQSTGYPLAVEESTLDWVVAPLSGTTVIGGRTYGDYDLTGLLKPAPAVGEVGLYTVRSSPTSAFLDGA